jgi:8-oxo-dGTP pyrophosphatase MutT (NUDIX family)
MQYHIYFNELSYWITSTGNQSSIKHTENGLILTNPDDETIKNSIDKIDAAEVSSVVIIATEPEAIWEVFKKQFKIIQAGGGLVKNTEDEYLFIFRRGKWDLPKGKLDDGETISECALREVNEETGLQNITLGTHLCNTYHTYHEKKKFILKESVWFNMTCPSGQTLTPQTEEDIVEVKWLKKEEWHLVANNIFSSITDVLNSAE